MLHPYQCLAVAKPAATASSEILVAACGHQIFTYDLRSGTLLDSWPIKINSKDNSDNSDSSTEIITTSNDPNGRLRKRRKILKRKQSDPNEISAAITCLAVTKDNRHVVATTGEDKSVHVFEVNSDGSLEHLSQRRMTKRPCAIAITDSDDSILIGDKFGDVYSLPLQYDEETQDDTTVEQNGDPDMPQPLRISATDLTVHTQRNLMALKNQMLQKQAAKAKMKDAMSFPHQLLLGHVSMLTDLLSVSVPSPQKQEVDREYIITCDRDEHVRISRGRHQAHIIENYCFGHAQFVNKLCLVGSQILLSGGGDSHIFAWDWLKGRLLGKIPVQKAVKSYWTSESTRGFLANVDKLPSSSSKETRPESENSSAISVSGIWSHQFYTKSEFRVFCACEAVPALFDFAVKLQENGKFSEDDTSFDIYKMPGNVLDIAFCSNRVVVSVDNIHVPGTTDLMRETARTADGCARLLELTVTGPPQLLDIGQSEGPSLVEEDAKNLNLLLYGAEKLRKRRNEDPE